MKIIKKKVIQTPGHYDTDSADERKQKKYLRQIAYWVGYYVFTFNDLDGLVTDILANRIVGGDINDYAYIFISGLTFNQKIELLDRIYSFELQLITPKTRASELKEKKDEIISSLKDIGKIRNTIIHTNYYSLDKDGYVREKSKIIGPDVEEHWVGITKDILVENMNLINQDREEFEEFDEDFYY